MADENQTKTSTQTAGETAENYIANVMGGMSGNEQPGSKPKGNGGDADQGKNVNDNGKGGEVQHPAWMNQIADEIKKDAGKAEKLSKFEKLSDLASAYLEAEGKLGNVLVKPGENSTAEEREAFYKALGKPDAADKYSIEGEDAEMFRKIAYENNLTDEQAKAFFKSLQEVGKNAIEAQKAAFAQQAQDTQAALQKEYGKDYPTKIEMLKRGVAAYGGEKMGAKLQQAGLLGDYDVVKMFILLGEQSAEAGSPGNAKGRADGYKSIADGGFLDTGDLFKKK